MKKYYIILIVILLGSVAKAQNSYGYDDRYYNYRMYSEYEYFGRTLTVSFIAKNHISSLEEISYHYKHGKLKHDSIKQRTIYKFDTAARFTEMQNFTKHAKPGTSRKNIYKGKYLTDKYYYKSNGEINHHRVYKYDSLGNNIEYISYKGNDKKILYRTLMTYDSTKTTEIVSYQKGGKKVKNRWVYNYFPNGYVSSIYKYNGKGKLKHVTTQECNLDTLKLKPHKDTSYYCNQNEYDQDSNKIYIYRQLGDNNKMYKYIRKCNKKGNIVESTGYNDKGIMTFKSNYYPDSNYLIKDYTHYDKKGKLNYCYSYKYDPAWKLVYEQGVDKKGKISWKAIYTYDQQGFKSSKTNYSRKNKIYSKKYFVYKQFSF